MTLFKTYHALSKVSAHPDVLRMSEEKSTLQNDWWRTVLPRRAVGNHEIGDSGKFIVCMSLLVKIIQKDEKAIVFSQSLATLDLMEYFMKRYFNYSKSIDYFRIDGSIAAAERKGDIDAFNQSIRVNPSRVFLVSTKAGSLGINLIGGNHVIIMDASWNPANDLQATFRCYRYGQTRSVHVYRLIAAGTIEQRIYERQMSKRGLALRIIDEHEVSAMSQDASLYILEDSDDEIVRVAPAFKKELRSCIVLDSDDEAEGGVKVIVEEKPHSLYGKIIDIPEDSPLLRVCAEQGEGKQRKRAIEILKKVFEEKERKSSESNPPVPAPPVPSPPNQLVSSKMFREFFTPMESSRPHRASASHLRRVRARSTVDFDRVKFPMPHAWIKGIHCSKTILQHQSGKEISEEEKKVALTEEENQYYLPQRPSGGSDGFSGQPGVNQLIIQVKAFSVEDVCRLLDSIGLPFLKTEFRRLRIDGPLLLHLSGADLENLNVPPGQREILLKYVGEKILLRGSPSASANRWQVYSSNGDVYYYDSVLRQSQWKRPQVIVDELASAGVSREEVDRRQRGIQHGTSQSTFQHGTSQSTWVQGGKNGTSVDTAIDLT